MEIGKVKTLVANFHDKTEYVIHIRNLKQVLNHGLVLKKTHKVIKFNLNAWLKLQIHVNTDIRKAENDCKKDFRRLMNNAVFGKTMENLPRERRRNYLVSEPNYHTTDFFYRKFIRNRNKKKNRDTYE